MFVRKKKNQSGSISIQIIDKSSGKSHVIKTIGVAKNPDQIKDLEEQGREYIQSYGGQTLLDFQNKDAENYFRLLYQSITNIRLLGPELLLGKIFDQIGFNNIEEELFRHLTITRLVYPVSKLKTIDYLNKYKNVIYNVQDIYRYLDKLQNRQKQRVQQISYDHTLKVLGGIISVVFYDVTTIYFEAEEEDELRRMGFSKEGKHRNPQILLGLLVSHGGYPLAYEIFEGNTYEGYTMLPVLEHFKKQYHLTQLIIIADAGLLNHKNIAELIENKYEFILGARIKNETEQIKELILANSLDNGQSQIIEKPDGLKLIVNYSDKRSKKDLANRNRGLNKLEAALKKGKLSKRHINNRGYNKYLKLQGAIQVSIDYEKFNSDSKWDGLKGYLTNTQLNASTILDHYKELWNIEKAFRVSKTDLRIRPIYHRLEHRIQAHICISFAAYKVYKELERQLKDLNSKLSVEKVIDILKTIYGIEAIHKESQTRKTLIFAKKEEQENLLKQFNIQFGWLIG